MDTATQGLLIACESSRHVFKSILVNNQHFRRFRINWMSFHTPAGTQQAALLLFVGGVANRNIIQVGDNNVNRYSFALPCREGSFVTHEPHDHQWIEMPYNSAINNMEFNFFYSRESVGSNPQATADITPSNVVLVFVEFQK